MSIQSWRTASGWLTWWEETGKSSYHSRDGTCPKLMWFPSQLTLPLYSAGALCQVCLADYLANIFVYTLESSRNINGQTCIKFSATQKVKVESMVSFATFGVVSDFGLPCSCTLINALHLFPHSISTQLSTLSLRQCSNFLCEWRLWRSFQ